jgi:type I restriction-modification system DNA methylase subunit
MNQIELQQQVLDLLQKFQGIDPLKELFWSHLNYDRVNKPIGRGAWTDAAKEALADDPTLLAAGGEKGDFHVVYSRLAKDKLSLADERIVTARLLKNHPYGLFVFSERTQTHWHFLNVQMADEEEKRKLYRRVTVGPNEKMRTACQVVSQLDLASIPADSFGLSPLVIQERHDQAFDVEPVTEEFYRTYHTIFDTVKGLIKGFKNDKDDEKKHLFTQRLFNRLMFIAFIQKKGWLHFGGKKSQDYLNALWSDYATSGNQDMGFYYERLYNLFFHGLGAQSDVDILGINKGGVWRKFIGAVPYLNGGLFEEDDDDRNGGIKVPDAAIKSIFHDLFDHFNFTVTEATPLDVEVAVDPEMLGKVFEELVTGRHETGSYYTPKPIVSFMCREALKGYLEGNLTKEKSEAIASFVDEHEPSDLRDAESALEALRRVRVCDPACGSGAYLLGMLHELMDLRSCLFKTKQVDSISSYDRKLEIIQRSLYGVDLDLFAVNIARLRLWLSLAVEFEGEKPEPLPNLKFEIEDGDSVSAPGPQPSQKAMRDIAVREFATVKANYVKAHGPKKKELEILVLDLKQSISTWTHGDEAVHGFDWSVEFADVFAEGGFDIVLANPPYVRQELIVDQKPRLKATFPEVYAGTADLFVYFYARALQILKERGVLAFISSNKWFRASYGGRLRHHIAESCRVRSITDFGELPVFKAAATFPMIFICSKDIRQEQESILFTQVKSLKEPYPDVLTIINATAERLPPKAISGKNWSLTSGDIALRIQSMEERGMPLIDYVKGQLFRGIVTGANKIFYFDGDTKRSITESDNKSGRIIKKLIVGDNVRRWRIEHEDRWVAFTRRGIDITQYPGVKTYLRRHRAALEPRPRDWSENKEWSGRKPGTYKWYEIQDEVAYYRAFESPKIIYPDICKEARFTFDESGSYIDNTASCIPVDDMFLLGVLNSRIVWSYLTQKCAVLGDSEKGGRIRLKSFYVNRIPIPHATQSTRAEISSLVKRCLSEKGAGQSATYEKRINAAVEDLFKITI